MRVIDLDAAGCRTVRDFCAELKAAIHAIDGHGNSLQAFVDSMVWGAMSELSPPYAVQVRGLGPGPVRDFVQDLANALGQARIERRNRRGDDVEVILRLAD